MYTKGIQLHVMSYGLYLQALCSCNIATLSEMRVELTF